MTITYLDAHGLDADACRALAGAHPLCAGYPEGVPETWGGRREALREKARALRDWARECSTCGGAGGGALDPAALLGPISEPVEPRPLIEALGAHLDAMEPLVSRLAGVLAAQINDRRDD